MNVIFIDDSQLVRQYLAGIRDAAEFIGISSEVEIHILEFLDEIKELNLPLDTPCKVFMDLSLSSGTPSENLSYINSLLPEAKLYIFTARRDYEVKEALNCSLQYTYVRKDTLKITDFADLLNPTTEKEDLDDSELSIE